MIVGYNRKVGSRPFTPSMFSYARHGLTIMAEARRPRDGTSLPPGPHSAGMLLCYGMWGVGRCWVRRARATSARWAGTTETMMWRSSWTWHDSSVSESFTQVMGEEAEGREAD